MPRGEGGGRPLKIKTPQEFEEKAMRIYNECIPDDGPVPTILWLEANLEIDFYRYLEMPKFRDIATRVKKKFDALYEQKANRGILVPQIAKMKLAHQNDYSPIVQEMDIRTTVVTETPVFKEMFAKAQALDVQSRSLLCDNLRSLVEEGEEDNS